jgi:hypothetical protein
LSEDLMFLRFEVLKGGYGPLVFSLQRETF